MLILLKKFVRISTVISAKWHTLESLGTQTQDTIWLRKKNTQSFGCIMNAQNGYYVCYKEVRADFFTHIGVAYGIDSLSYF